MCDRYRRYPYSNANSPRGNYNYMNDGQYNPRITREVDNMRCRNTRCTDHGPNPFVVNIEAITEENNNYRTTIWTGDHLQLTLMSINPGEDIGLEMHPHVDQFIRIEEGKGMVQMGPQMNRLDFRRKVSAGYAIIIPAGTWHNLTNTGNMPIKLYSIYAPPNHPFGTVHVTKADAEADEADHNYHP